MYAVLAITDLAWTDADIEKIAAEAKQMADQQMGRNTNWDEWAFGH